MDTEPEAQPPVTPPAHGLLCRWLGTAVAIGALDRFFLARAPRTNLAIALLLLASMGVVDHVTGYEVAFSIFYVAPVALAAWYASPCAGLALAVLSAAIWTFVDWSSGHEYSHVAILFWNGAVRLGFFVLAASLLGKLREHLRIEGDLARRDGLTGLLNARAFAESARGVLELARRHGHVTALGYVDLDNFKALNDRRGHLEGDRALKAVADALSRSVRQTDVVARMGGDEFAVLLPETPRAGAETVFNRVREQIAQEAQRHGWPVTPSVGVAVFPAAPVSVDDAVHVADEIMYEVKRRGKNRVLVREFLLQPHSARMSEMRAPRGAASGGAT